MFRPIFAFKMLLCVIFTFLIVTRFVNLDDVDSRSEISTQHSLHSFTVLLTNNTTLDRIHSVPPKTQHTPGPIVYSQLKVDPFCDHKAHFEKTYLAIRMNAISFGYGLGNRLFEIFALRGMAERLNRTAIFAKNDKSLIKRVSLLNKTEAFLLKNIELIYIEPNNTSRYPLFPLSRSYQHHKFFECDKSEFVVLDGTLFQSFKYFTNIEAEVLRTLEPKGVNRENIGKMVKDQDKLLFKTCVHVRRGDFRKTGRLEASNDIFTIKAIEFLRKKNDTGIIYILSDDMNWVDENVLQKLSSTVGIHNMDPHNNNPIDSLFFSRTWCDSVLITAPSSTFGWWLGYLAKNRNNVYYRDIFDTTDQFKFHMIEEDYFLPNWIKIGYDEKEDIVIKS